MSPIQLDGIVGTRPNFMKMAPLARALAEDGTFQLRLIHTGQHYDQQMSDVFFRQLGLPTPDVNFGVGAGAHGVQTARILESYETWLTEHEKPRGIIVVGDVTSTMACALAAAKLNLPIAHVEAGLRSGDRSMPEEINRIVTDVLAELLFVSDPEGLIHLAREGRPRQSIFLVGNLMVDTLFHELQAAERSAILQELGLQPGRYVYLTLHRPSNVDDAPVLRRLIETLGELARDLPFVFAVHPRTRARLEQFQIPLPPAERFRLVQPLSYRDNLRMIQCAHAVFTDSGGIQEETSVLQVPCLTLRQNSERPITVELGSSELVGNDPARIQDAWERIRNGQWKTPSRIPLWDGCAAARIVGHLRDAWGEGLSREVDKRENIQ